MTATGVTTWPYLLGSHRRGSPQEVAKHISMEDMRPQSTVHNANENRDTQKHGTIRMCKTKMKNIMKRNPKLLYLDRIWCRANVIILWIFVSTCISICVVRTFLFRHTSIKIIWICAPTKSNSLRERTESF